MTYEEVNKMSKRDISKGVPITDIRVLPITLKLVEQFCEALKRCKNNPDYLYSKTYTKTTERDWSDEE